MEQAQIENGNAARQNHPGGRAGQIAAAIAAAQAETDLMATCYNLAGSIYLSGMYPAAGLYSEKEATKAKNLQKEKFSMEQFMISRIAVLLLNGFMNGLSATEALNSSFVLDNKATIFGNAGVSILLRNIPGHIEFAEFGELDDDTFYMTATVATASGQTIVEKYSLKDALQANLVFRDKEGVLYVKNSDGVRTVGNWNQRPKVMIRRKLINQLRNFHFPHILAGVDYVEADSYEEIAPVVEVAKRDSISAPVKVDQLDTLKEKLAAAQEKQQQIQEEHLRMMAESRPIDNLAITAPVAAELVKEVTVVVPVGVKMSVPSPEETPPSYDPKYEGDVPNGWEEKKEELPGDEAVAPAEEYSFMNDALDEPAAESDPGDPSAWTDEQKLAHATEVYNSFVAAGEHRSTLVIMAMGVESKAFISAVAKYRSAGLTPPIIDSGIDYQLLFKAIQKNV